MAKVLLVEDDNNLREIYQARLAAEGYEISSAQDGEEALVVAKQAKPDLVISDVMMPKISGFEMLDILRNTAGLEHVKVIMLTALGQSEDRDRADSLGADKYLVKSQVTLEDIVKTAHELLDGDSAAAADVVSQATASDAPVADSQPPATPDPVAMPVTAAPPEPTDDQTAPAAPTATPSTDAAVTDDATTTPSSVTDEPAAANGSATQEEALVQSQIDNFVQNASVAPPAEVAPAPAPAEPVASPAPAGAETTTTPAPPEAVAPAPEPAPSPDDQLVAQAADELASSAQTEADTAASPAPAEAEETPDASAEATADNPADTGSSTTIGGKKVIHPLDSEPKPDIHELLAKEEAAGGVGQVVSSEQSATDAADTPAHQPGQSFDPQPTQSTPDQPAPAPDQKGKDSFDPNSVAL